MGEVVGVRVECENTRPPIEAPNEPAALSVAFNNDNSRFAVGTDSGFGSEYALFLHNYVIKS